MEISSLLPAAADFDRQLTSIKLELGAASDWYPHSSLGNLWHLDRLLTNGHRDLSRLIDGRPVADVGAADGDLAFFLAHQGVTVDVVDNGPTNWNHLRGARLLAEHFGRSGVRVNVHEVDLDTQFSLPRDCYGLVLLLGILYHVQNPFYVLKQFASHAEHLLLSTRIARVTRDGAVRLDDAPVAYLVDPFETNNDPTNYWIFSLPGLRRLIKRTGWSVLEQMTVGRADGDSDPSTQDRDERAFFLLRTCGAEERG